MVGNFAQEGLLLDRYIQEIREACEATVSGDYSFTKSVQKKESNVLYLVNVVVYHLVPNKKFMIHGIESAYKFFD